MQKKIDVREILLKRGIEPLPEGVSAIALAEEKRKKELEEVAKNIDNCVRGKKEKKKKAPKVDEFKIKEEELQPVAVPWWSDNARRVPSALIRCAIFAAIRPGRRRSIKDEVMAVVDGVEIVAYGEQLDQEDLNVWLTALHLCRGQSSILISSYKFLKAQSKKDGGENRRLLDERLNRLKRYEVKFRKRDPYGKIAMYRANLLAGLGIDDGTGMLIIDFNPRLVRMLYSDAFTDLDYELRNSLEGQQLAQWLHAFYSSHAQALPYKVETLHKLCGSAAKDMNVFAQSLKRAFACVESAYKEQKLSFKFSITNGVVRVEKTPSIAQRRYLKAKESQSKKALPRLEI